MRNSASTPVTGCATDSWEKRSRSASGYPVDEARDWATNSEIQQQFRGYLFSRIVPIIKDIGLWGPKIRHAFGEMGVLDYADNDIDALVAEDETIAEDLDRKRLAAVSATADLASD